MSSLDFDIWTRVLLVSYRTLAKLSRVEGTVARTGAKASDIAFRDDPRTACGCGRNHAWPWTVGKRQRGAEAPVHESYNYKSGRKSAQPKLEITRK